jgi:hypothetical protein
MWLGEGRQEMHTEFGGETIGKHDCYTNVDFHMFAAVI